MANILLTGVRLPAALGFARSLREAGHTVFACDSIWWATARASNSITKSYIIHSPRYELKKFTDDLIRICENHQIDLIIPCFEEIFYIAKIAHHLPKSTKVFMDEFELLVKLHNKYEFINLVKSMGLSHPKTYLVDNELQLRTLFENNRPLVFKRVYSRFSDNVIVNPTSFEQLASLSLGPSDLWLGQEYIEGRQICTYSVVRKGQLLCHVNYLTELTHGQGTSVASISLKNQKIVNWIKTFVSKLNFTGQISFDFIEKSNGEIFPIECNPRATSGIFFFSDVQKFGDCFEREAEEFIEPPANIHKISSLVVLLKFLKNVKNKNSRSTIWQAYRKGQDVAFKWNDLSPFFWRFACIVGLVRYSKRNKLSTLQAATDDIAFNGE